MFKGKRRMLQEAVDKLVCMFTSELKSLEDLELLVFQICVKDEDSLNEVVDYIRRKNPSFHLEHYYPKGEEISTLEFRYGSQRRRLYVTTYKSYQSNFHTVAYVLDDRYLRMIKPHISLRTQAKNSIRKWSSRLTTEEQNLQEIFAL